MGNNFLAVLLASIKGKITPILTKAKLYTSPSFIKTRVLSKIRVFFTSLFDVRPKHKKDYYEILGWLVSKKLAFSIIIFVGALSIVYLVHSKNIFFPSDDAIGLKTYNYNSVLLRFANEKVRIKGKSGYLAYEGDVAKGAVTGQGILFNPEGNIVYQGAFDKNRYEGLGVLNYANGNMCYQGSFSNNLFEGTGTLYRENGSKWYQGDFSNGMKEGEGRLFNNGSNLVYEGDFSKDELVYANLIGKTQPEIFDVYTGAMEAYDYETSQAVVLSDIDAMYSVDTDVETLEGDPVVNVVYILDDVFKFGGNEYTQISDIKKVLGVPIYEGNAELILPEAVALQYMNQTDIVLYGDAGLEYEDEYDDVHIVSGFNEDYVIYVYSFRKDGLIYTFVCPDRDATFGFYNIQRAEDVEE